MMCSLCSVVVSLCPLEWIHTGLGALMCLVTRVPAILVAKLTFSCTRHRGIFGCIPRIFCIFDPNDRTVKVEVYLKSPSFLASSGKCYLSPSSF